MKTTFLGICLLPILTGCGSAEDASNTLQAKTQEVSSGMQKKVQETTDRVVKDSKRAIKAVDAVKTRTKAVVSDALEGVKKDMNQAIDGKADEAKKSVGQHLK
jgi:hypothetical protein